MKITSLVVAGLTGIWLSLRGYIFEPRRLAVAYAIFWIIPFILGMFTITGESHLLEVLIYDPFISWISLLVAMLDPVIDVILSLFGEIGEQYYLDYWTRIYEFFEGYYFWL